MVTMESTSTHAPTRQVRVARTTLAGIAVFAALGTYAAVESLSLGLWSSLGPGPGLFPFAMGCILVSMSVLWLLQELRRPSARGEGADGRLVAAVVISLVLLAALLDILGFQVGMFLFLLYHLRLRGKRSWPLSLVVALAGSVGAFYAFSLGLNVELPTSAIPALNTIGL